MGRRPDPPELQAAKGHPGKRRGKAARRQQLREQVVAALAAASSDDLAAPPALHDPRFAGALAVWKATAGELKRTHRLPAESRLMFVTFCVYAAEWLEAQMDVADNGHTQSVATVAGGRMERRRPILQVRQQAFDNMMKLADKFGLTPHDLYALFKDQAAAAANNPGLFDDLPGAMPGALTAQAPAAGGLIGSAARLRSAPPKDQLN